MKLEELKGMLSYYRECVELSKDARGWQEIKIFPNQLKAILEYIDKLVAVAEAAKELNEYDGHYADIDGKLFNNLSLALAALEDEK